MDESKRLGNDGAEAVKSHPWFKDLDWKQFADCSVPAPAEIVSRIKLHTEGGKTPSISSPSHNLGEEISLQWIEDW